MLLIKVEFMNESRFDLSEFLERVTVRTFSRARESYDHLVYNNNNNNQSFHLNFDAVALKKEGLCYTAKLPSDLREAGVASITFELYDNPEVRVRDKSKFSVLKD